MKSMTGFGRGEARQEAGGTTWEVECSSVNRKQLEISVSLPRDVGDMEALVRAQASALCSRGRINIQVRAERGGAAATLPRIDHQAAQAYVEQLRALAAQLGISPEISLSEVLRLPGVLAAEGGGQPVEEVWPAVQAALAAALGQLVEMRAAEGAHLRADIEARLATIEDLAGKIATLAATVPETQRQILRQRLEQAGLPLPLDDERLLREIALFADRTDISEELARAASHLRQFRGYLASQEPVGRSLDFLVQEFFREFNTMGSKCAHAAIAHHVVAAKTELEKIREQVQNIE